MRKMNGERDIYEIVNNLFLAAGIQIKPGSVVILKTPCIKKIL